jgi:hypothetical protein
MKHFGWLLALVICISACSHQQLPGVPDPSKRIDIVSGVSILPPQEPDWKILSMSSFQLALGKRANSQGETYAVVVSTFNLPKVETEEEFLKNISDTRAAAPKIGRFVVLKQEETLFPGKEGYCLRYHTVSGDNAARIGSEKRQMIFETRGYICQHPQNKLIGINVEYSHRYFGGNEDPAFEAKANAFWDQVQFTDF